MAPKKSTKTKATLKKTSTMAATAAAGREFLKNTWGAEKLKQVNELLDARDKTDDKMDDEPSSSSSSSVEDATATTTTTTTTTTAKKGKPKLVKGRTMKNTAKEAKALIAGEVLGDTRSDTKRRQAADKAKKALREVTKSAPARKPALKRLGTMAKTAKEGREYIKGSSASSAKKRGKTGGKRNATRTKK